jgi:hypothetical protein
MNNRKNLNYSETTELWDLVASLRDENQKNKKFEMKYSQEFTEKESKKIPRIIPNETNLNPLDLSKHYIGDVRNLLQNEKLKNQKRLESQIQIKMQQNPKYFDELLKKFQNLKEKKNFNEFLEEEVETIMKESEKRDLETQKSLEFLSQYFLDHKDVEEYIPNMETFEYKKFQQMVYRDRVMSVFEGKEKIFEDPFGLGLEPSMKPFHPYHFNNAVFDEEKDVKIEKRKNVQRETGSNFDDFLKNF